MSSIPGLGRSSEVGDGNPFQILAWRIPRTEQPGGLQSRASQTVGHDSSDLAHMCNRQMATSDFWVSLCCSGKQNASACSVMYNLALQWTVVHQDPLFMVFSRQEYQSRLLFPTAGDISHPWNGIHVSYIGRCVLYHCTTWDALRCISACVCACMHALSHSVQLSRSVVSNSLQPHGLQPTRLFCAWNFPGKNIGVAIFFSKRPSWPRDWTCTSCVSYIAGRFFPTEPL